MRSLAVVIAGFVMLLNFKLVKSIVLDVGALSYSTVQGQVLRGRIIPHFDDSDIDVEYQYSIFGIEHHGTVYRRSGNYVQNRCDALRARENVQIGQPVLVHYDPQRPDESCLEVGIRCHDMQASLILAMFNAFLFAALKYRRGKGPVPGKPYSDDGTIARVSMGCYSPVVLTAIIVGVAAFISGLLGLPVVEGGLTRAATTVAVVCEWLIVVIAGGITYRRARRAVSSGLYDLVVDRARRTVHLPKIQERSTTTSVPWSKIASIAVEDDPSVKTDSSRVSGPKYANSKYVVNLAFNEPIDGCFKQPLAKCTAIYIEARQLAEWIGDLIGKSIHDHSTARE